MYVLIFLYKSYVPAAGLDISTPIGFGPTYGDVKVELGNDETKELPFTFACDFPFFDALYYEAFVSDIRTQYIHSLHIGLILCDGFP